LTIIAIGAAGAALVSVGWRAGRGNLRAALWAAAAGAGFGLAAGLMKASTALLNQGVGTALSSWKPYATVAAGVAALYLFQNAVQAGRLIFAQPAIVKAVVARSADFPMAGGSDAIASLWIRCRATAVR
jgi:hypothetical protein